MKVDTIEFAERPDRDIEREKSKNYSKVFWTTSPKDSVVMYGDHFVSRCHH